MIEGVKKQGLGDFVPVGTQVCQKKKILETHWGKTQTLLGHVFLHGRVLA